MIKRTRERQKALSEINIVNLVDVILVLLIIFMLTAPYLQGGIEIDLPKTRAQGRDTREGMIVSVTADPAVYIEEDGPLSLEQLGPEIARRYDAEPGAPVYLRADQGVPYGYVVAVIALIKEAGFVNLGLVTEPLSESWMKRRS
jgi:biopolymer transport protein ExbD